MVTIRRGEQTFTAKPLPQEPDAARSLTDLGYLFFDAVTWCQMNREQALKRWNRMEALKQRIEQNPGHPDNRKAHARIHQINNGFLGHQQRFLYWEDAIHTLWKNANWGEREGADAPELCHALPADETLPPLWHHPLGSQEGAPLTCKMTTTALQFSTPANAKRYRRTGAT